MADVVDLLLMAASREPYRRAAISHYHSLLERYDVAEFAQELQDEMRSGGAIFGERLLCPFLRPHFIGREQLLLMQDAVRSITGACAALCGVMLESEEVQNDLGITETEKRLIAVDPGYPEFSVSSRLDSFLSGGSLQFVEYNAETPAGISYSDVMGQSFMKTRIMHEFMRDYPCSAMYASDRLFETLMETYAAWGGKDKPVIGIIDYEGLPTRHEFELCRKFFTDKGCQCLIADPRRLEYKDGKLMFEGQVINLVYKRLLVNEYLEKESECQAVWEAYKNHAACFVNNFRCKFFHKKAIFALLTDPKYQKYFTAHQIYSIFTHIPWTRLLRDVKTAGPKGEEIELMAWARQHKDNLILKPNDDYGGHGIYVGWELSQSDWENALQETLPASYLLQTKVNVAHENYPSWDGEKVGFGEYAVDLDPYIFKGRAAGFMTRLSGTALCNVTSGGGATATIILD